MFRILVLLLLLAPPAFAIDRCASGKRVTCVVDGDTVWLKGEKIRAIGFDTPETQTNICGGLNEKQLGSGATDRLIELLNSGAFTFERDGQDRYGRTLAHWFVDGVNVGDVLVAEGLARYWPDGEEFWCN